MRIVAGTDIGKNRVHNEDSYLVHKIANDVVCVVADGLGGYSSGEIASGIVCRKMLDSLKNLGIDAQPLDDRELETLFNDRIRDIVREVNSAVISYANGHDESKNMGSTLSAIRTNKDRIFIVNVGDSIIYGLRDGALYELSFSHTIGNMFDSVSLDSIGIGEEGKKLVTSALGNGYLTDINYGIVDNIYSHIILSTDGLTDLLSHKEILDVFRSTELERIPEELIKKANENGGFDNITVVVVEC